MNRNGPKIVVDSDECNANSNDESSAGLNGNNSLPSGEMRPKEVGGRGGLEPTRYGDWEKAGRCIDF